MKVILLQYVKGIGDKGQICEVSDGYAQNALIPKGLAKVATSTEINKLQQAKKAQVMKEKKEEEQTLNILTQLNGKTVTILEKLNEKGRVYHALGLKEIIKTVQDQLSLNTHEALYIEKYALKEAGEYQIGLKGYGLKANLTVIIKQK